MIKKPPPCVILRMVGELGKAEICYPKINFSTAYPLEYPSSNSENYVAEEIYSLSGIALNPLPEFYSGQEPRQAVSGLSRNTQQQKPLKRKSKSKQSFSFSLPPLDILLLVEFYLFIVFLLPL